MDSFINDNYFLYVCIANRREDSISVATGFILCGYGVSAEETYNNKVPHG